ncbi:unnamed protein product, partial [Rotaria sp. Silwood2]
VIPESNIQQFINSIWSLSKLIYSYLNIYVNKNNIFILRITSKSLKHAFIWDTERNQNEINALIKKTPHLEEFSIILDINSNDNNK